MGVEEGRGKKEYASSVSRERERERERSSATTAVGGGEVMWLCKCVGKVMR